MPSIVNMELANGQNTVKTFSVVAAQAGSTPASWIQKIEGPYSTFPTLTSLVRLNGNNTANKTSFRVVVPYRDAVSGIVARATCDITFTLPHTLPSVVREDIFAFAKSLLAHGGAKIMVVDSSPAY